MVDMWTYGSEAVLDPDNSNNLLFSVTVAKVYAADKQTELTPLDTLGNPTTVKTQNDGIVSTFQIPRASNPQGLIWLQFPGITNMQKLRPDEVGDLLLQVTQAVAAAQAAAQAAQAAQTSASSSAAQIENSTIGQILGPDGKIRPELQGAVKASLAVGSDANGTFLDPTPEDTADRIYIVDKAGVEALLATAGTDAATVKTLVRRDAAGRFLIVDPLVPANPATKNYVDQKFNDVSSPDIGSTPKTALFNGTAYVYAGKNGTPVNQASRADGRPCTFIGGEDPANSAGIWVNAGDIWEKEE